MYDIGVEKLKEYVAVFLEIENKAKFPKFYPLSTEECNYGKRNKNKQLYIN